MTAVRRALIFSTADRYFALISNFLVTAAVSRILTPAEIGIFVLGQAILGFALSVKDFASSGFIIQREELTRDDVRASFTVTLLLTSTIVVALLIASPFLSRAYGTQELGMYFHVVCICLFLDLVANQVITLLRRDMAFTKIAVINIAGASVGAVATIAFALAGFSYMSFAWSWLLAGVVTAVTSIIIYPQPWIFRPSLKNWRGMVRFGAYNGASVMLYSMYDTLTYMSFGWVASAHAAAIFNRGMMLCQLPGKLILSGAVTVVLPAFSQHYREGRSLKAPYLHTVALITGLHWPALLVLSVLADPVVKTLFGSQWHDVVPLVRIIAIASLFTFNFQINYQAMVAMGAMRESFLRALITYPLSTVVMVMAIWTGGLEAAAWSMMFIVPFQAFIAISFIKRRLLLSFAEIGMVLWKSAVVAMMAAIGPLSVVAGTDWNWHLSLPLTALAVVFAALGWGAGLAMTKHPLLGELTEPMSFLRMKLSTRFGAARFSQ